MAGEIAVDHFVVLPVSRFRLNGVGTWAYERQVAFEHDIELLVFSVISTSPATGLSSAQPFRGLSDDHSWVKVGRGGFWWLPMAPNCAYDAHTRWPPRLETRRCLQPGDDAPRKKRQTPRLTIRCEKAAKRPFKPSVTWDSVVRGFSLIVTTRRAFWAAHLPAARPSIPPPASVGAAACATRSPTLTRCRSGRPGSRNGGLGRGSGRRRPSSRNDGPARLRRGRTLNHARRPSPRLSTPTPKPSRRALRQRNSRAGMPSTTLARPSG